MTLPTVHFKELQADARSRKMKRAPIADRLPHFLGAKLSPAEMVKALASLRVFLIGAGSVGRVVAAHLARLGLNEIKIADPKHYTHNLITQSISPAEVGRFKASSTGRLVKSLNPHGRVLVHDGPAQDLPLTEFGDTLVVLATDNLTIERFVSDCCMKVGSPLIQGSVHGDTLTAQIRFLTNKNPAGPCLCCQYGPEELSAMSREMTFSCAGYRSKKKTAHVAGPPTMSNSATCSLAGDLLTNQILRWRLGLGAEVGDTELEHNCYSHRTFVTALARNPHCFCPHERYSLATARRALGDSTLRQLAQAAGVANGDGAVSFTVDDLHWAEDAACRCAAPRFRSRFVAAGQKAAGRCARCAKPFAVASFMTRREVPADVLGPALDQPLRALGAADPASVLVRLPGKPVLFRSPAPKGFDT